VRRVSTSLKKTTQLWRKNFQKSKSHLIQVDLIKLELSKLNPHLFVAINHKYVQQLVSRNAKKSVNHENNSN
jgi:hypothetical protein